MIPDDLYLLLQAARSHPEGEEELYLRLKDEVASGRLPQLVCALELIPAGEEQDMLRDLLRFFATFDSEPDRETGCYRQSQLVAMVVSVMGTDHGSVPLLPARLPNIEALETLPPSLADHGDVQLTFWDGLIREDSFSELGLVQVDALNQAFVESLRAGLRPEALPGLVFPTRPLRRLSRMATQYLLIGQLQSVNQDPRQLLRAFEAEFSLAVKAYLDTFLNPQEISLFLDVAPLLPYYEAMEGARLRTSQFEVLCELFDVFVRHDLDMHELLGIVYPQDPDQIRASVIYFPANQILAGVQRKVPAGVKSDSLVEQTVDILRQAGFGRLRVAPRQEADAGFLTLADLGPRAVHRYL